MKISFRSLKLTVLVLLMTLGCLDKAMAQNSIGVSPTSLSFCVASNNSPAPPAQTLTVTSTSSSRVGYNANAFPTWIRLNGVATPPSISGDTVASPTITVTIDPSAYSGGGALKNGTIQIQSNSTFLNLPVTLTVTPACVLSATPGAVSLSVGQTYQSVTVNGQTNALITAAANYGVNNPSGWFNISATSLVAGQSLSVALTTTNLLPGTTGSVLFTRYATNDSVSVPVIFSAGGNGTLPASPSSVNLIFASSSDAAASPIVTLGASAATLSSSVSLGTGPVGWLTATQPSGSPGAFIQVTVNPANLPNGTTVGSVTVTQSGTNNFVIIPVSATAGSQMFSYSPTPFSFTVPGGSLTARNQVLTISGPNNAQVVATAHITSGGNQWLTLNGGAVAAGTLTNSALQLTVSVNPALLAPNMTFTGSIVFTEGATTVLTVPVTVSTFPSGQIRDFAGNGLSGALQYDPVSGTAYTALSNGNGLYQYVYNLITPGFDTLRTGDYNGDGKADLIVYNSHTSLAYIGMGNGDGTFSFQSLFWSPGYDFVLTGDLNGDGKTDVGLYNSATGTLYIGISNGAGAFAYKYTLISPGFTFVRLADFTGDGKADLFAYNKTTGAAYLGVGDSTGGFTFSPLFISPGYDLNDAGDLNGDGKADVILYNSSTGNAATGTSIGVGFAFTPLIFSPGFTSVRLADFTGDGYADVTLYSSTTAVAYFGTGTGTGNFTFQSLFWSPGYDNVEPEDINGDGKSDILLYNSATGTEYTGISNGNGTFSFAYQYWGTGKVLAK